MTLIGGASETTVELRVTTGLLDGDEGLPHALVVLLHGFTGSADAWGDDPRGWR